MALNNLQRLICHKTQTTNQPTNHIVPDTNAKTWKFLKFNLFFSKQYHPCWRGCRIFYLCWEIRCSCQQVSFQDLFKLAPYIFVQSSFRFFSRHFVWVQVVHPYSTNTATTWKKFFLPPPLSKIKFLYNMSRTVRVFTWITN